jgi:hypothetical protein
MTIANINNEKFFLKLIREGKLKVTKDGRAFNLVTGRQIGNQSYGYKKLSWQHPKTKKIIQIQLHRLVWAYFNGIPDANLVLNHIDGNKQNCALSNLELVSVKENNKHAQKTGLVYIPKGEEKPNAIFSDEDVRELRKLFATNPNITCKQIALQYNCHVGSVSSMLKGVWYKHIVTKYDVRCKRKLKLHDRR